MKTRTIRGMIVTDIVEVVLIVCMFAYMAFTTWVVNRDKK